MTKNRGFLNHQNGKNNGQRQTRRQAEIAKGKYQKNKTTKKTGNTHKNMQNRNTKKTRKKHETIAIARTSSVAQKIS